MLSSTLQDWQWLAPTSVTGALGLAIVLALVFLVYRQYDGSSRAKREQQVEDNELQAHTLPRVFVALPSLGLDGVVDTITSLMDGAFAPRNITVGVVCSDPPQADILAMYKQRAVVPFEAQVLVQYSLDEPAGPNVARAETLDAFITNQDFVLFVDAHTEFEPNWDRSLYELWQQCKHDRAVLTGMPHPEANLQPVFSRWSDNPEHTKSREPELLPQMFARKPSPFQKPMPACGCAARCAYGPSTLLAHPSVRRAMRNVPGYEGGDVRLTMALHHLGARMFEPVHLPLLQHPVATSRGFAKAKVRPKLPPIDTDSLKRDLFLLVEQDDVVLSREALQGHSRWLSDNERAFRFGYVRL